MMRKENEVEGVIYYMGMEATMFKPKGAFKRDLAQAGLTYAQFLRAYQYAGVTR